MEEYGPEAVAPSDASAGGGGGLRPAQPPATRDVSEAHLPVVVFGGA